MIVPALPGTGQSALFGVFATLALLVFADFGGPLRVRAAAYLATTAVAVPVLAIGVVLGQSVVGAVAVMAVVAALLGMAAVLRGVLAAAQSTLLLATVLAVTSAPAGTQWQVVWSWIAGGLIATAAALLLWPVKPSPVIRLGTAQVFRAVSQAMRCRWCTPPDPHGYAQALDACDAALGTLHAKYDGNLLRPSGLTASDRATAELVDIAGRLRRYQRWIDVTPAAVAADPVQQRSVARFAATIADQLAAIADRLEGTGARLRPEILLEARNRELTELAEWVEGARTAGNDAELIRQRLDDVFPLRLMSVNAELAAASIEGRTDFRDHTVGVSLDFRHRGPLRRLTAHLSWDSPWFRNALRTAAALALSVLVAKTLALGHEFWIVLGTLTALRFDALGTGRTAAQALLGTTVGVALASVLILVFADDATIWWILLPITLFVCAFTPGTFSLAYGQAAFSVAVLVLFSLLFPTSLQVAELRLVEVAIGLAVSLLVSLIMWPRGVVATLYRRMRESMAASTDHLVMAVDLVCGGGVDRRILTEYSRRSAEALELAQESYDLSVASKPPTPLPLRAWSRVALASWHVHAAALLVPGMEQIVAERGPDRVVPTVLAGPLLDAAADMRGQLRTAVATWQDVPSRGSTVDGGDFAWPSMTDVSFVVPESVVALRVAINAWLAQPSDWIGTGPDPRPMTVTWLGDWAAFIAWNADLLRRDLAATG